MPSWPVRRYLWLLVAVLLSMMLVITAVSLISLRTEYVAVNNLTAVIAPAEELNTEILRSLANADTGLDEYLATGDRALLASYEGAEPDVNTTLGRIRALLASPGIGAADQRMYARQETAQDTAIADWRRHSADAVAEPADSHTASLIADQAIFGRITDANDVLDNALSTRHEVLSDLSRRTLDNSAAVLVITTVLAVLVGLVVAIGISRAVTAPIIRLRQVMHRHDQGETDLLADTGGGTAEVRALVTAFNVLSSHNAELLAEQAEALRLQRAAADLAREIRATPAVQEATNLACAGLGPALSARRVGVTTFDEKRRISLAAQWHAPDLEDITIITEDLVSQMARIVDELWLGGGRLVVDDLRAERQAWAGQVHRETGATALILAPIGQGDRAIGNLYVAADAGSRQWSDAEAALVQQVATSLARAITQAEAEARRAEYIGRLEDLDRQKTEFLATVSHELRTPLTSIQGYLELLLEGDVGPLGEDQQRMLAVIERNTSRLRGLIEDILVLNKIESGGLLAGNTEVPVSELADHTAEELRPLADKKSVRLCVDTAPATVIGDRTQLHRALVNIMSNAIKFTPPEGTVVLSCQVDLAAKEVVVTCADTGIGIPEADLAHLFTRFFRASNAASQAIPGTGLGLAIVQAIVEIHQGRLALDSVEGEGTTITMRFPSANGADHQA